MEYISFQDILFGIFDISNCLEQSMLSRVSFSSRKTVSPGLEGLREVI